MKRVIVAFCCGIFVGYFLFNNAIIGFLEPHQLAEKAEAAEPISTTTPTPTPIATPTETPTPSSSPKPSSTPKASLKPTPSPLATPSALPIIQFTSAEINAFIDRFAAQYLVDPNVIRHIALCESQFNPLARNGDYGGLFQFGPLTWKNYRRAVGEDPSIELRFNAEEAVQTAAYAMSLGKFHLWPNCHP